MRTCKNCKWLDEKRTVYWRGCFNTFFVCRKNESAQIALNKVYGKNTAIFAPSYLATNGRQYGDAVCVNMELEDWVTKALRENELEFDK